MENRGLCKVMIALGAITIVAALVASAAGQKETAPITEWETYNSESGAYTILYPKGWKELTAGHEEMYTYTAFLSGKGAKILISTPSKQGALAELSKPSPFSKTSPVQEAHEEYMATLPDTLNGFSSEPTAKLAVAGYESYGTQYGFTQQSGVLKRHMKGMVVTAWNGSNPIHFQLRCPDDQYDVLLEALKHMLTTFKAAEPTPSATENPLLPGMQL